MSIHSFKPFSFLSTPLRRKLLVASICLTISACGSSKSSTPVVPGTSPDPGPGPVTPDIVLPETEEQLDLDYSLPLSDMGVTADVLSGATFDPDRGEFVVVGEEGNIVFLSQEGSINQELTIEHPDDADFTGIEYMQSGEYLLSSSNSKIFLFELEDEELETIAEVDFDIAAVAYDGVSGSALVIDNTAPSRIIAIAANGDTSESELELSLDTLDVQGLTIFEDNLIIAAINESGDESGTFVIVSDLSGSFGPAWHIDSTSTSSIVLLDPETPEFMTTNNDSEQTLTLYEAELPASVITEAVLPLISVEDLDFDQPSGVDYVPETMELFYITDFAEVRRGSADGANELLFEFEAMQGSFEAIAAVPEDETLYVMFSDDATEQSQILTLDFQGNQTNSFTVPIVDENHLFESLDYNDETDIFYTVSSVEGTKVLYRILDGEVTTTELPSSYDDFDVSGIDMSQDSNTLYFVTEEWTNPVTGLLSAGLLVQFDLINNSEIARYSLAIEEEGEVIGIRDPSGIAINEEQTRVYVTSDIDDAEIYVFELN